MKKYIAIFSIVFLAVFQTGLYAQCGDLLNICHGRLGNARFLRSWPVQLPEQNRGEAMPSVSFKMALTSGITYKIFACNAQEFPGRAIISIRNHNDDLVVTSYMIEQRRHIETIMFPVGMSGIYTFTFYFEDGRAGCAVGVIASVN